MKPVRYIEGKYSSELPEQEKRWKEIQSFWDSSARYAEVTIFNPKTRLQTEITHYKDAVRQLGIGRAKIRFCQRKGKIYAERVTPTITDVTETAERDLAKYYSTWQPISCKIAPETMEMFTKTCQETGFSKDKAVDRALLFWAKGWEKKRKGWV